MAKIVSFDLDGTLVDWSFADSFWFDCMGRLYAERWDVPRAEAVKEVRRRYELVGMDNIEWYNIRHWWQEFGFSGNWEDLINECRPKVTPYPDSKAALEMLGRKFKLIVITNGVRELAEVEIEESGFGSCFDRVFSATSDFGLVKKTGEFYLGVLDRLDVRPSDIVHVGDNYVFDYLAPREAGIEAYFLDREGKQSGDFVVRDLREFARRLL